MSLAPPPAPLPTVREQVREIVSWVAAAALALMLAIAGLSVALLTGRTIGHARPEDLAMSTRQFERAGRNLCGDRVGSEVFFWLRHGDQIQIAGGLLATVLAVALFIAALRGRRGLVVILFGVGVLAIVVPALVGRHLDREFWQGPPPDLSAGNWSTPCFHE